MGWRTYKHRFVPWASVNWPTRLVQAIDGEELAIKQSKALRELGHILRLLSPLVPTMKPKDFWSFCHQKTQYETLRLSAVKTLQEWTGFSLTVGPSLIEGGGNGVFVCDRGGKINKGQLVALYPGTIYLPFDPLLIQSINNSYILRCVDGIHVDGKHTGLSRMMYKSCALRDVRNGSYLSCDLSWLTLRPLNPFSIGQLVNNQNKEYSANVEYLEIDIPSYDHTRWSNTLDYLLPNISYGGRPLLNSSAADVSISFSRVVALLATRDIAPGEELYSSYFATMKTT